MPRKHLSFTLALCGLLIFSLAGCSGDIKEPMTPKYKTNLAKGELKSAAFGKEFPLQYVTYQRNTLTPEQAVATTTMFKSSIPFRKNDDVNQLPKGFPTAAQPYLKNLWLGYPFMYEYNEARGHTQALHDILEIDRINRYDEAAGLPATCWNCKTPIIAQWVEQYGDDKFWSMNFNAFRTPDKIDMKEHSISCATCHDAQTMELALYSAPLKDYLAASGQDWATLPKNDKRALVCAQCHVEYYFQDPDHGPARKPVFPWALGKDPEQMFEYYKDKGAKKTPFADWVHPVSKVASIKAQHPEYEFWYDGTHGAAGVTCADCHMPYVREDGSKKISSHLWTSPLRNDAMIDNSCRQCHTDKTAQYLRERVQYTQKKSYERLLTAQEVSVRAHEAVRQASEWQGDRAVNYDQLMKDAREMVRKGQFFWDLVSAENSVGFHNPAKALDTLSKSQQYSQKAVELATAATNYGIANVMHADIKQLVPPLLEWSRKLQMDPANLEKHTWTKYLKPLPSKDLLWDLQKRLDGKPSADAGTAVTPVSMAPVQK